jgi:hypothetical protein
MKMYLASWGITPHILNLGTRWKWMVSFTPRPSYPRRWISWYPVDRRLGATQSRPGRGGEEKNLCPCRESNSNSIVIVIIIIILQGICQSRPVPAQNFNFWTYESIWTFSRTPWTGDQPDARPLHTQNNTTQKNVDTHPCSGSDSNPRSQRSNGRRQYRP